MLDDRLRHLKDRLLADWIARRGLNASPTMVTGIGLFVGLAGIGLTAQGAFGWGLLLWVANRLLDAVDGALARGQARQSDLGGYLDILADYVVYAGVPIALVVALPSLERYLALALLLASFYINTVSWAYLAALLEKRARGAVARGEATSVTMPAGLIGGIETTLFYALFLLFPARLIPLFALMTLLVVITVVQRLAWARREL